MRIELYRFLTNWHGAPDAPPSALPGAYHWLPEPLKDWYGLSSRWTRPLMTVKRMRAPEHVIAEGHKAVFMEDPTGNWRWAFDMKDPDAVYAAELNAEWEQVAERLPEFLMHNTLHEAAYNARSWRACPQVEEHWLADVIAPMTEVAFGGWRWPAPGCRIFMNEMMVAEIGPALGLDAPWEFRSGYAAVRVASNNPACLGYLDGISAIDWLAPLERGGG
jgi:hypothetical protein